MCELISTLKKAQAGNEWSTILSNPRQRGKKPPSPQQVLCRVSGLFNASSVTESIMALSGQTAGNRLYINLDIRNPLKIDTNISSAFGHFN